MVLVALYPQIGSCMGCLRYLSSAFKGLSSKAGLPNIAGNRSYTAIGEEDILIEIAHVLVKCSITKVHIISVKKILKCVGKLWIHHSAELIDSECATAIHSARLSAIGFDKNRPKALAQG